VPRVSESESEFGVEKAIVLLSGGLDSVTALAMAKSQGFDCYAISFSYGQRHDIELKFAREIAKRFNVLDFKVVSVGLNSFGGSALTDKNIAVPNSSAEDGGIPVTYVPARNTVFLSLALAWAEVVGARNIFIGVNAVDYSGYPDCRLEYIKAFEALAKLATKAGVEGGEFCVHTPLIQMTKAEIISVGLGLGVDYSKTVSCYSADNEGRACGLCDACKHRKRGFEQANVVDPTRYQKNSK